jgi:hypothetical protein
MKRFLSAVICVFVCAAPVVWAQSGNQTSTATDRKSVNITVYNSNVGLVRETREINLRTGQTALNFADVAALIRPETVHLASLTSPASLSILEQNYQYDLLNPGKLLDKYVGREITLVLTSYENNTAKYTPTPATLLANNAGQVWRINGNIVINPSNIAEMRFPEIPDNLVPSPTLLWELDNQYSGTQTLEASYLTAGLNWRADYVLVLNADDTSGDMQGWVTMTNQSGVTYKNARLQLVAGELNRVNEQRDMDEMRLADRAASKSESQFTEQSFFEYHLYTMHRPATIREQETKQLSLLEAAGFKVVKEFVVDGQQSYYRAQIATGSPIKDKVGVFVQFANAQSNQLGLPLPAGVLRLYKRDPQGGQQFIGEDRIDHTPKDEDVRIKVGDAFDVVSLRKQTDYRVISSDTYEYAYEIKLRNHKDTPITVIVNEPIGGDWRILSSSYKAVKTASDAAQFRVPVAKDGESVLTYRVRVRY